jgi:hypothetical protein
MPQRPAFLPMTHAQSTQFTCLLGGLVRADALPERLQGGSALGPESHRRCRSLAGRQAKLQGCDLRGVLLLDRGFPGTPHICKMPCDPGARDGALIRLDLSERATQCFQ